jgi:hypothetical protein
MLCQCLHPGKGMAMRYLATFVVSHVSTPFDQFNLWWKTLECFTKKRLIVCSAPIFLIIYIVRKHSLEHRPLMRLECCVGVQYSNLARDFYFYITTTNLQCVIWSWDIKETNTVVNIKRSFVSNKYQGSIINLCHQFINFDTTLWLPTPETLILSHIVPILMVAITADNWFKQLTAIQNYILMNANIIFSNTSLHNGGFFRPFSTSIFQKIP